MEISISKRNNVVVLDFKGNLDRKLAPKSEMDVNKELKKDNKVIMNLEQTVSLNKAGLNVILATARKLMAVGGKFRLCGANRLVKQALDLSGFSLFLDVKPNLKEAMSNF